MTWRDTPIGVRVPATSANLGPGFDALGLALARYDSVEAQVTGGGLTVEVSGEGAETAVQPEAHLVVRAARACFAQMGVDPPGLAIRCVNSIPHGRGLGSSAAAIVSGVLAARALVADGADRLSDGAVLQLAVELEGHPDNVAACLAGGLTIAWSPGAETAGEDLPEVAVGEDTPARVLRLEVHDRVRAVVCLAPEPLPTREARDVLPATVAHGDAAANAARSALLIAALTAEPSLLFDATEDFLHQRHRAALMPESARLLANLRAAGVAAVISGAGPSILALYAGGTEPGAQTVDSIARETGIAWNVIPLDIDRQGARAQTGQDATAQPGGLGEHSSAARRQGQSLDPACQASVPGHDDARG